MPNMPDAVILCGGAGLRLRTLIGEAPKGMASVAGRPFLEVLLRQLARYGCERAILAVGYQSEVIQSHFGERAFGLELVYSTEATPLGTGGALRNAASLLETGDALVMNGDSYTDVDLSGLVGDHRKTAPDVSVVVVPADGRGDCGFVLLDGAGRVVGFDEKRAPSTTCYVNAGIYLFARGTVFDIPAEREVSLERELLPLWLQHGKHVRGFIHSGECIDIGTPERYHTAQTTLANVEADPCVLSSRNPL